MDERFEINGIYFVWNPVKALENFKKHGVVFEEAAEVFFDPFLRLVDASAKGEARDAVIGLDKRWNLLFVVHMVVEGETIRVISARHATRRERNHYEN